MSKIDLCTLSTLLISHLPQTWSVTISKQTTCQGPLELVRVESATRSLVCFISIGENPCEIVIVTNDVAGQNTTLVVQAMRKVTNLLSPDEKSVCFTLTECPMNCPNCPEAKEFYQ